MIIYNAKIFTKEKRFIKGSIWVKDGLIIDIIPGDLPPHGTWDEGKEELIDAGEMYAIPGMIDMHFHGCAGFDFCDGTKEALKAMASYQVYRGVTCIAPASMTLPADELKKVLRTAAEYKTAEQNDVATLVGINMEGPFISAKKKGAQDEKYILPCDTKLANEFLEVAHGLIKVMGVAPEHSEAMEFIEKMKSEVTVSIAHSDADYEKATMAIEKGVTHIVHLFNGMSAFVHREPGIVGAAMDKEQVTAELICDGLHVHPAVVRGAFRMFGSSRLILISDSMRATGLSDGIYKLGELDVEVKGNRAVTMADGALAGSVTNLSECVRIAVEDMHIPLEDVVPTVTINPAKRLGIEEKYGTLEPGKCADIVLMDEHGNVWNVWKNGGKVK